MQRIQTQAFARAALVGNPSDGYFGKTIRYETNIPRAVGLAGSSAIIVATFRALMQFYNVSIPHEVLPNWILATERDELKIMAGLQDRVAQVYEGVVYMDFDRAKIERDGYGIYEPLNPQLLPPVYLAYQTQFGEVSDVVHNDLRERWNRGDGLVHDTMRELGAFAARARECIMQGRHAELSELIDANFECRRRIVSIREDHGRMVEIARSCGASAHFAGSGGTIVGTYADQSTFTRLQAELGAMGCRVLKPKIG